jgi:hypothetical protein
MEHISKIHESIERKAWHLMCIGKINFDHYCAIVEWSNVNLRMWLSNDMLIN